MEHPFLLADNRHYVFYAWRKIYKRHWMVPYALTPLWVLSATIITDALAGAGRLKLLQHAGLVAVTALTIVPSPLIEPRYFILPYLLLRLFLKPTRTQLLLELAWYAAINASTIWVFLHRPFLWANDPSLQRFLCRQWRMARALLLQDRTAALHVSLSWFYASKRL